MRGEYGHSAVLPVKPSSLWKIKRGLVVGHSVGAPASEGSDADVTPQELRPTTDRHPPRASSTGSAFYFFFFKQNGLNTPGRMIGQQEYPYTPYSKNELGHVCLNSHRAWATSHHCQVDLKGPP